MSSHELTSHLRSFQSVSRFGTYASRLVAPAVQFPIFSLSDLICYLSLCTSAIQLMREPCNVLQSGPRFDFLQLFFPFRNLCKSYSPLPSSSLWTYAAPLPSSPFLSFCCKSKLFNSKKLQISNPRFPLLLFTLSNTQTHKLHYRSTSLSGFSATLQYCKSRETPCQPSGSTRCPINMAQGSQRKPSRVD